MCLRITQFGRYSNPRETGVNRLTPDFLALCEGILSRAERPNREKLFAAIAGGRSSVHAKGRLAGFSVLESRVKGAMDSQDGPAGGCPSRLRAALETAADDRAEAQRGGDRKKSRGDQGPHPISRDSNQPGLSSDGIRGRGGLRGRGLHRGLRIGGTQYFSHQIAIFKVDDHGLLPLLLLDGHARNSPARRFSDDCPNHLVVALATCSIGVAPDAVHES